MKKFTTSEISKLTGLSRQRLHQLREGYFNYSKKNGVQYKYWIEPKLIKGKDWNETNGQIFFYNSTLNKLKP